MANRRADLVKHWIAPATAGLRRLLGAVASSRGLLVFVSALFAVDLLCILYFGVAGSLYELRIDRSLYDHEHLLVTKEGGWPEWFNYAKTALLVVLLARLTRKTRQPIYGSLAMVYLFVVLDDSLGIHEAMGKVFVRWLDIPRRVIGLRDHDVGEVITWALVGLIVVPLVLFTLARSRGQHRENGLSLLTAFGALLFCAVFVDQLYSNFHDLTVLAGVFIDAVEDGGEMLAITFACALALGVGRKPTTPGAGGVPVSMLVAAVFVMGLAVAFVLQAPGLSHFSIYKADTMQSPHWSAYHASSFQDDDLILRYASFNESPLQNAIYWVGTFLVDQVTLSKIMGILGYGAMAALFFLVGRAMFGTRFGLLLALFVTLLPDQWDYSVGFFSKFWAIPLLLVCVYLLRTDRWSWLLWLLPFAALAYPTAAVMIGMTAAVYWSLELFRDRAAAWRLFRWLAIGSVLAVTILMAKYLSTPDGIGPMRPGAELRAMAEVQYGGYPSYYVPVPPFYSAMASELLRPFTLLSAALFVLVLGWRRTAWERSWTALLLASVIGYIAADLLFFRLYVPNRYIRYSLAVLVALWSARNWDLVLDRVRTRLARTGVVAALVVVGFLFHYDSFFKERLSDRRDIASLSFFVGLVLPEDVLFAGSPRRLDDLMVQAKRSVLCPYRLAHPWFTDYYDEIRRRTRDTLRAHFASDPEALNMLHRQYGVTHFLVEKNLLARAAEGDKLYPEPYNREIYEYLGERREFFLDDPPPDRLIWEDRRYAILELPIPTGGSGDPGRSSKEVR